MRSTLFGRTRTAGAAAAKKPTTTGTTSGPSSTRRGSLCTRFACVCACFEQNIHAPGYLFRAYKIPHVWVCVCVCALGIAPTAQQQKTVSSALALPRACNLFRPGEEPTQKKCHCMRACGIGRNEMPDGQTGTRIVCVADDCGVICCCAGWLCNTCWSTLANPCQTFYVRNHPPPFLSRRRKKGFASATQNRCGLIVSAGVPGCKT